MNIDTLVRSNIRNMKPYSSARDEFEGAGEVFLDANENPFNTGLNRYPDPYQRELKKEVAVLKGVNPNQLFLGNGSDEAIDLILRIFCQPGKDQILTTDPTYGMYQVSAAIQNIEVIKVPLSTNFELDGDAILNASTSDTKVIFVCTPMNPSGNDLDHSEIKKILDRFEGIVVIDEAYIDFTDAPSFTQELTDYPNLIVLQTFSKAWGMAALRLGMAFADTAIIEYFNKVKAPYNLNILAQREALKRIKEATQVAKMAATLKAERDVLIKELKSIPLTQHIFPSSANFLLVRFDQAKAIFRYLVEKEIIVRDRTSALHCKNCLRITVGMRDENEKLIAALKMYNP